LVLDADAVATLKTKLDVTPTEDEFKYELKEVEARVKAIWNGVEFVEAISENSEGLIGVVVDCTNFYAEQGGQIHDSGVITVVGDSTVRNTFSPYYLLCVIFTRACVWIFTRLACDIYTRLRVIFTRACM